MKTFSKARKDVKNELGDVIIDDIDLPRSTEQIKKFQFNETQKLKLSIEASDNIRALRLSGLDKFINYVAVEPELCVHLSHPSLINLTNQLIKTNQQIIFNYDTTFNLSPYFVTPIVTRNIHFIQEPIYPVAFLVHERKFENTHLHFLIELISKYIKLSSSNTNCAFMHDRERAISNAIESALRTFNLVIPHFNCINHLNQNIKRHSHKRAKKIVHLINLPKKIKQC